MADSAAVLPCSHVDGSCMICSQTPPEEEVLPCMTCASSWHVSCLAVRPDTVAEALEWECPGCSPPAVVSAVMSAAGTSGGGGDDGGLIAAIRVVEADESSTEGEKAKKRQEIMSSKTALQRRRRRRAMTSRITLEMRCSTS